MVSKKWIKKLSEETNEWLKDNIIDSSQRERILSRYSHLLQYSRLINTVITLGSILIGLGILLFIASNWDKIGRAAKILIIFITISSFNLVGYYFHYIKRNYRGLAEGFTLIGAFAFGAGVWLIAQIYQIHYNFSAGILFWIVGILPLAYLYRSWIILSLTSILGLIWLVSYQTYYSQREGFGVFLLLVVFIILSYMQRQRFPLFVTIVTFLIWLGRFWSLQYNFFDYEATKDLNPLTVQLTLVSLYMFFGFILYSLGLWHSLTKRFDAFVFLYKFLGVVFICGNIYSLTFSHHYYSLSKYRFFPLPLWVLTVTFVVANLLIFFELLRWTKEEAELKETRLMLGFLSLSILSFLFSLANLRLTSPSFNITLIIISLGFMYLGFIKHSEGIFRLAIVIFFINMLSRYFDIFWAMMPRSLLFIFGGMILVVGAIFGDRKRREIERQMQNS
jgi:uncharacterized membrane protein